VGGIARDDDRTRQRQARLDRIFVQRLQHLGHRAVGVDFYDFAGEFLIRYIRQETGGIAFQLLQEDAIFRNLAQSLTVGGARNTDTNRQAGAVARQADHPHIVAKILTTELRTDPHVATEFMDDFFHLKIAEALAHLSAFGGQVVQILRAGELHGLQIEFRRRAADNDRQMIGRAGRRSQRADLLVQEVD